MISDVGDHGRKVRVMEEDLTPVYEAVDKAHKDQPALTRRAMIASVAGVAGSIGLLGLPGVANANWFPPHNTPYWAKHHPVHPTPTPPKPPMGDGGDDPATILAVAATKPRFGRAVVDARARLPRYRGL